MIQTWIWRHLVWFSILQNKSDFLPQSCKKNNAAFILQYVFIVGIFCFFFWFGLFFLGRTLVWLPLSQAVRLEVFQQGEEISKYQLGSRKIWWLVFHCYFLIVFNISCNIIYMYTESGQTITQYIHIIFISVLIIRRDHELYKDGIIHTENRGNMPRLIHYKFRPLRDLFSLTSLNGLLTFQKRSSREDLLNPVNLGIDCSCWNYSKRHIFSALLPQNWFYTDRFL